MNTTELRSLATRRLLAGLFFVIMAAPPLHNTRRSGR